MSIALPGGRIAKLQTSAIDLLEQVLAASAAQLQSTIKSPDPALLREARLVAESAIKVLSTVDSSTPAPSSLPPPLATPRTEPRSRPAAPPPADVNILHPRDQRAPSHINPVKHMAPAAGLQHLRSAPARSLLASVGAATTGHPP